MLMKNNQSSRQKSKIMQSEDILLNINKKLIIGLVILT